jgi:glycerol kinase
MTGSYLLALDQGTTSTRAIVYDAAGRARGSAGRELTQHYPQPGWVEHDPEEIWQSTAAVVSQALVAAGVEPRQLAAIGVTNQRETSVLWDRATGRPLARALVWQDRRTADFCRERKAEEGWLTERTGLVLDPYFSGTKVRWLLENDAALRRAAEAGRAAFGTIDTFLIWRLTGGTVHATDVTNASRTLFLNLRTVRWDPELCRFFSVPEALLPDVRPSAADYGATRGLGFLPDGIPIRGVAGDQQAALFGQRCFAAGEAKCTYGTGAFFLLHAGPKPPVSRHRLLATLAATTDATPLYALEGSVFIAGAAVQWLRDGLKLFATAEQVEALARQADEAQEVYFVPALVGLGAPHWVPETRGALFGLTRATTAAELSRAALDGVAFQVVDLVDAAVADSGQELQELRVDGGMARNDFFLQLQADLLGRPLVRDAETEATAFGAALLAGLKAGVWPDLDSLRRLPRDVRRFQPALPEDRRRRRLEGWRRAVRTLVQHHRGDTP